MQPPNNPGQRGQPPWLPQPGQFQPPPPMRPPDHTRRNAWLIIIAIMLGGFTLLGILSPPSPSPANTPATATPTVDLAISATALAQHNAKLTAVASTPTPRPKLQPTPRPTPTPQPIHYPPKTLADLRGLAAQGDMSAIHEFHSESVGAVGACPEPKREVTVDPSVTGQQLAEDLLAYFYTQQLDSPCGSVVFAYHNQGEANDVYTAGRILFDVTDSSGQVNLDPNATNLKHTLTLDIGGDLTNPEEYVVTY